MHEAVKALGGTGEALTDRVMAAMEAADRSGGDRMFIGVTDQDIQPGENANPGEDTAAAL